jgi:hypothetical protein
MVMSGSSTAGNKTKSPRVLFEGETTPPSGQLTKTGEQDVAALFL